MAILSMILYLVILLVVSLVVMLLGRKYVFSKIRVNKFIPLTVSIVVFFVQAFLPAMTDESTSLVVVNMLLGIVAISFFLWFLDIQISGGPKEKEKEIVIRPKAKPNRVKNNKNEFFENQKNKEDFIDKKLKESEK